MNTKGRIENSIKNSGFGFIVQVINIVLGFVVRTIFVKYLGSEYLGVNGLFTNILTILSLAELGVSTAIVYNMYKPIANNDYHKIAQLMNLYKKTYSIVGIVVAVFGVILIPFLDYIIKDQPDIDNLKLIYVLYLSNTVLSYFFAYKRSIFSADQNERTLHMFRLVFFIIKSMVQVVILITTGNFILYLLTMIICTFLENVFVSFYSDKQYPFLKQYRKEQLTKEEKQPIFDNIKALFIYKIGGTILDGTDSIIISAFDSVANVGLLSNYTLISGSIQMVLSQMTNSLTGSIGNFIAKEESSRHEGMLRKITFFHFVLYGLVFVGLMSVFNPFIVVWLGRDYVLDEKIVFVHCLNIYIFGMMNPVWSFRTTMGLFVHGKWRPVISAIVNVVISILLVNKIGLIGVLLGTTVTRVVTNVWYDPLVVYKYGLKAKPYKYYLSWFYYLVITIACVVLAYFVNSNININGILGVFINGIVAIVIFAVVVFVTFFKTVEFKYFKQLILTKFLKKTE